MTNVHFRFEDGSGNPIRGIVFMQPSRRTVVPPKTVILPASVSGMLSDGETSIDVTPNAADWVWRVEEPLGGKTRFVVVPKSDETVEYASLESVDESSVADSETAKVWRVMAESLTTRIDEVNDAAQSAIGSKDEAKAHADESGSYAKSAAASAESAKESAATASSGAESSSSSAESASQSATAASEARSAAEAYSLSASESADASKRSEENAASSAASAQSSASSSSSSAESARTSETNAATSEANAKASEEASRSNADDAAASAESASSSASSAGESASAAKASEANAAASASSASGSEASARSSAEDSAQSASEASTSAQAAKTSETNAASSASAAATSETNAAASATAAQNAVDNFGLEAGTTTTGDPGTDAAVEIVKDGTRYRADFTIPRGAQGEQGVKKDALPDYYGYSAELYSGKFLNTAGVFDENSGIDSYVTGYIRVTPGQVYSYKGYSTGTKSFYFFNENFVLISTYDGKDDGESNAYDFEVPENAVYMRVQSITYNAGVRLPTFELSLKSYGTQKWLEDSRYFLKSDGEYLYQTVSDNSSKLDDAIFDIGEPVAVHPLYSEMTKGNRLVDDGTIQEQTEAYVSDFISLDSYEKTKIHVRTKVAYVSRSAALYDANKQFIKIFGDASGTSEHVDEFDISIPDCKSLGGAYLRFGYLGYDDISEDTFEISIKSSINIEDYVKNQIAETDVLYGKKYVACGDSFTAGAGLTGEDYDHVWNTAKSYPWWIAKRHNMTLINEAQSGSDFTNVSGASNPFSLSRYKQVPTDADYITLMFGLNETNLTEEQIGSKTDSDNSTLWGAYNVVFEYFLTNMPFAKIGVIIADAWMPDSYASKVREICEYWGIPYLDLKNDVRVPMGIGGRYGEVSSKAVELRNKAFQLSDSDSHPNAKAHEYRSTFIENFLKSL